MKKIIFSFIITLVFSFSSQAQTLQASVNRNPIPEGEAFILTLRLENPQNSETPDLKPLEQDFNVYSVSNSSRINIINGTRSDIRQWDIGLIAKKTGDLSIPAIKAGNISSNPLVIKVISSDNVAVSDTSNADTNVSSSNLSTRYALKTEISNKNPYVQQQIDYTVTLVDAGGLQGDAPFFVGDGSNNDWIVQSIGSPNVETKTINGQTIREIKFRYALFPQKSGRLKLPIVNFRGFYLTQDRVAYDPFADLFGNSITASGLGFADIFATRHPVNLVSKSEEIDVRPIATENNGNWWLPAQNVELFSEWTDAKPEFKVGEAVTRTVYLKAVGVAENQLPEINFPKVDGVKQYPEKQQTESRVDNGRLVSVKKAVNVYIPNQSGAITLPAIQVPWFNVAANRMEKALLPEVRINVSSSSKANEPVKAIAPAENNSLPTSSYPEEIEQGLSEGYVYLFIGLAFVLGVLFSFLLLKFRNRENNANAKNSIRNYQSYIALKAHEADFKALRDGLLEWGVKTFPEYKINNLKDVADCVNSPDFSAEMKKLMTILYSSKSPQDWSAEKFVQIFNTVYKKNKKTSDSNKLIPDLYK